MIVVFEIHLLLDAWTSSAVTFFSAIHPFIIVPISMPVPMVVASVSLVKLRFLSPSWMCRWILAMYTGMGEVFVLKPRMFPLHCQLTTSMLKIVLAPLEGQYM